MGRSTQSGDHSPSVQRLGLARWVSVGGTFYLDGRGRSSFVEKLRTALREHGAQVLIVGADPYIDLFDDCVNPGRIKELLFALKVDRTLWRQEHRSWIRNLLCTHLRLLGIFWPVTVSATIVTALMSALRYFGIIILLLTMLGPTGSSVIDRVKDRCVDEWLRLRRRLLDLVGVPVERELANAI
jgi:hypothetical protein